MSRRTDLINDLVAAVGGNLVRIDDLRDGWPSLIAVRVAEEEIPVSAYISPVSSMSRKTEEIRFQNPGQDRPIQSVGGSLPLLLGIVNTQSGLLIVGADAQRRLGLPTRFSVLFRTLLVQEATALGWASHANTAGENIFAFRPFLFPLYVEQRLGSFGLKADDVTRLIGASGDLDDPAAQHRARIATSRLMRDERFRAAVVSAYDARCAMCDLDLDLVVAAHILPVKASGSTDIVPNGVALCENHHRLFDSHRVFVSPASFQIRLHPTLATRAREDDVSRQFVEALTPVLRTPADAGLQPDPQMLDRRYAYFGEACSWMSVA